MRKLFEFLHEIGTIMYVGGILSHIVIANVLDHNNLHAIYYTALYKEKSAYILILPGLLMKITATLWESKSYAIKPLWLKIQYGCMAFLTINAIFFLFPMMPTMTTLAAQNLVAGKITAAYQDEAAKEMIIGISNALPLLIMVVLSALGSKPSQALPR